MEVLGYLKDVNPQTLVCYNVFVLKCCNLLSFEWEVKKYYVYMLIIQRFEPELYIYFFFILIHERYSTAFCYSDNSWNVLTFQIGNRDFEKIAAGNDAIKALCVAIILIFEVHNSECGR